MLDDAATAPRGSGRKLYPDADDQPGAGDGQGGARAAMKTLASDVFAGLVASVVVLSYCVSYSALLFPGSLQGGLSMGLWSMLVGSIVAGIVVGVATSIPPISAGPDTPGIAMMSLLGAAVTSNVLAAGGTPELAVRHVLLAITLATAVTGLCMLILGWTRSSKFIRFVPYPVASGFMGATGLLMVYGSIKLVLGHAHHATLGDLAELMSAGNAPKLIATAAIAAIMIAARHLIASSLSTPATFIAAAAALDLLLWKTRLIADPAGWFSAGLRPTMAWSPLEVGLASSTNWAAFRGSLPEILAIAGVMVISLLVKISNMEVARSTAADLDREFAAHGIANLASAAVGGVGGGLMTTASRVLADAGSRRWVSGLVCSAVIATVLLTHVDLTALVPTPVLSGLLIFLGYTFLLDTLGRPSAGISLVEAALVALIILICLRFGYPAGVLVGFVASCVLFVFRYSRIGVTRRHSTRADLSTSVDRSPEDTRFLRETGDAIHVYWLSGYLFFGSSDALFERVRASVAAQTTRPIRFVVLDFAGVTGVDMSALKSLAKLTSYCDRLGIVLAYAGLSEQQHGGLERGRYFGGRTSHMAFPTRTEAMEWCEERLLDERHGAVADATPARFEDWLVANLEDCDPRLLLDYFERREVAKGTSLYRQGAPSDTIDLVASGSIAITLDADGDRRLRVRRMAHRTVVGEMGFFRGAPRTANVEAEADTVLYTLTRESYERMRRAQPQLGQAFLQFIVRALADRVEFANREIAALT